VTGSMCDLPVFRVVCRCGALARPPKDLALPVYRWPSTCEACWQQDKRESRALAALKAKWRRQDEKAAGLSHHRSPLVREYRIRRMEAAGLVPCPECREPMYRLRQDGAERQRCATCYERFRRARYLAMRWPQRRAA